MRIAIFGATGRTGKLLLKEAAERGWATQVLIRDPLKLESSDGISVTVGDARSPESVAATLRGVEAVFSCLALTDISVPGTELSDCMKTIIAGMKTLSVSRILAIASSGELDHPDGGYRNKEGLPDFLQYVTADQIRSYEALRDSGVEWTLMCPSWLQEDIPVGRCKYAFEDLPCGSQETGYADLAHSMAELVNEPESIGQRVGIVSFR